MQAISRPRVLPSLSRKRRSRALAATVAWISTPGNAGSKGMARMSAMPISVAPTKTSLFFKASFGTVFLMTSAAETVAMLPVGP